jgi:hypothetical protein
MNPVSIAPSNSNMLKKNNYVKTAAVPSRTANRMNMTANTGNFMNASKRIDVSL